MRKFILLLTIFIPLMALKGQSPSADARAFIADAVELSFAGYPGMLGTDLRALDTIAYPAFDGREVLASRQRDVSVWLYPELGQALFQYRELLHGVEEAPTHFYHLGMADREGQILWTVDSGDFFFTLEQSSYHPQSPRFFQVYADKFEGAVETHQCLIGSGGRILFMEKEPVHLLHATENDLFVSLHPPLNPGSGPYRLRLTDLGQGKQWEKYFTGTAPMLRALHPKGTEILISRSDTLICLDHQGKEKWRKYGKGMGKSHILTSGFNTFLVRDDHAKAYLVFGKGMADTLASYPMNILCDSLPFMGLTHEVEYQGIYGIFPQLTPNSIFGMNLIGKDLRLSSGGRAKGTASGEFRHFRIMGNTGNSGFLVYFDRKMIFKMEGWNDGKERSIPQKSD
ncbi:MAG TPA: hypothetical protein P5248_06270 [Bacteroidales bacterium]|nr:hypothetical protein [Bacteroidales bacterium]